MNPVKPEVYLIEHENPRQISSAGTSQMEKILRQEGYDLGNLSIEHLMFHYSRDREEWLREDILHNKASGSQEGKFRYFDRIRFGAGSTGSVLGHPESEREDELDHMAGIYAEDKSLESPYFVLTQPEEKELFKKTFEKLGFEVKDVKHIKNKKPVFSKLGAADQYSFKHRPNQSYAGRTIHRGGF